MPDTKKKLSFLEIATDAAFLAGEVLQKYWENIHIIDQKAHKGDLVTEADKESEKVIIDFIQQHLPDHQILAEESGLSTQLSEYCWIIDPLDGTTNYAHHFPHFAVSIALVFRKLPIVGVVYNPISNELFHATKGGGAKKNGMTISVSNVRELESSLLATGFPYDRQFNPDNNYQEFCHFTHITEGVRRAGAAALDLAYVASGRLDGYWERGIKPWDVAAGSLLVEEAGGLTSNYNSEPLDLFSGEILATNAHLNQSMSQHLKLLRFKD